MPKNKRNVKSIQSSRTNTPQFSSIPLDDESSVSSSPYYGEPSSYGSQQPQPVSEAEAEAEEPVAQLHRPLQKHYLVDDRLLQATESDEGFASDASPHVFPADKLQGTAENTTASVVEHIRSPMVAHDPSPLESFSRTLRNYVPSSIPIPTAAPSPPRVSRPVSLGSFLSPSAHHPYTSPPPSVVSHEDRHSPMDAPVFDLDEEVSPQGTIRERPVPGSRYPGLASASGDAKAELEDVLWSGWNTLVTDDPAKPRRLLLVGYATGLQAWDCTDLGHVVDILNLTGPQWGMVRRAGVLPSPRASRASRNVLEGKRPIISFISESASRTSFVVYSLCTHEVLRRLDVSGLQDFSASDNFIVLSASNPVTLTVLSASTFDALFTIPAASLVPFVAPAPSLNRNPLQAGNNLTHSNNINSSNRNVPYVDLDDDTNFGHARSRSQHMHSPSPARPVPHAVFAHSHRLLAFASPTPTATLSPPPRATSATPRATEHSPPALPADPPKFTIGALGVGVSVRAPSQAELGTAAAKLGGSVLSGMRSLGGLAMTAARAGVNAAVAGDAPLPSLPRTGSTSSAASKGEGTLGRFFSRSAPAAAASSVYRASSFEDGGRAGEPDPSPYTGGCSVTVVDLQPLLASSRKGRPFKVAEFAVSGSQPVSALQFSPNGTSVAVSLRDGHSVKTYQLTPTPGVFRSLQAAAGKAEEERHRRDVGLFDQGEGPLEPPPHIYTFRRGRTSAVVERMDFAGDGRWAAIGTRKRTVHVFATNPYGGRTDEASHMHGRVVNPTELPLQTELSPILRLRTSKMPPLEVQPAPLAFTFVRSSASNLPPGLAPVMPIQPSMSSSPSSVHSGHGQPLSPRTPRNFQDVLLFDPCDGMLSLCRVLVDRAPLPADSIAIAGSVPIVGGTSISLPGMSSFGRLSTSPSQSGSPRHMSALTQLMEASADLIAKESRVAQWMLRREKGWEEVKKFVQTANIHSRRRSIPKADWLSHAELSTSSASPRILPRTIYLSHQFTFHAFGEDYHALLRSYHFNVPTRKIEVRKEVEASAYAIDPDDAFVQGLQDPGELGRASSSFDEPLASALQGDLDYLAPSHPILPMYPNGAPGASSRSLRNAIPIRTVTGTMSGGFGRLRREIGRVRSPRLSHPEYGHSRSDSVPLEFDEDDELFVDGNVLLPEEIAPPGLSEDRGPSHTRSSESSESLGLESPSPNLAPLPAEDGDGADGAWHGWELQDQQAVEDAERFHDITAGYAEEPHEQAQQAASRPGKKGLKGRKKK